MFISKTEIYICIDIDIFFQIDSINSLFKTFEVIDKGIVLNID